LVELKTGFRAKYIYDAVSRSLDGSLSIDEISNASDTDAAIEKLCTVKGIGEKVASCALLFGFRRYDAFPIDVWMKRAIDTYFDGHLEPESLGRYAGVAQQYIFHYIRNLEKQNENK
jgi:N-glycosylase/DNA lyase